MAAFFTNGTGDRCTVPQAIEKVGREPLLRHANPAGDAADLARVHVRQRDQAATDIAARVASAFAIGDACPPRRPLLLGRIDARSIGAAT